MLDVVCSNGVASLLGFTISCTKFVAPIADTFIHAGEIEPRVGDNKNLPAAGPAGGTKTSPD